MIGSFAIYRRPRNESARTAKPRLSDYRDLIELWPFLGRHPRDQGGRPVSLGPVRSVILCGICDPVATRALSFLLKLPNRQRFPLATKYPHAELRLEARGSGGSEHVPTWQALAQSTSNVANLEPAIRFVALPHSHPLGMGFYECQETVKLSVVCLAQFATVAGEDGVCETLCDVVVEIT